MTTIVVPYCYTLSVYLQGAHYKCLLTFTHLHDNVFSRRLFLQTRPNAIIFYFAETMHYFCEFQQLYETQK